MWLPEAAGGPVEALDRLLLRKRRGMSPHADDTPDGEPSDIGGGPEVDPFPGPLQQALKSRRTRR